MYKEGSIRRFELKYKTKTDNGHSQNIISE